MSMEITWLEFQLSTENQNGRHLATNFFSTFFQNSLETWYRFSGSASLLVLSVFMLDWKLSWGGHFDFINFNKSFLFSINCLGTWHIYRVTASAEGYLSACTVFFFLILSIHSWCGMIAKLRIRLWLFIALSCMHCVIVSEVYINLWYVFVDCELNGQHGDPPRDVSHRQPWFSPLFFKCITFFWQGEQLLERNLSMIEYFSLDVSVVYEALCLHVFRMGKYPKPDYVEHPSFWIFYVYSFIPQ